MDKPFIIPKNLSGRLEKRKNMVPFKKNPTQDSWSVQLKVICLGQKQAAIGF